MLNGILAVSLAAAMTTATGWQQTSSQTFYLTDALQRSQGVTSDGQAWYFSWQYGLSRVSLDGKKTLSSNTLAIPAEFALKGSNHIGGIDYYNGKIYAPIEDGDAYQHPHIALYNASNLSYTGTAYALPQEIQRDGVPWTAVDAERGFILSSEYDATAINAYSLTNGQLVKRIPLSQTIPHLQGAHVYEGHLYATSDSGTKAVYEVDLDTGAVTKALDLPVPSGTEVEGLTFLPRSDGSAMHVLDVAPNRLSVNFRHFRP